MIKRLAQYGRFTQPMRWLASAVAVMSVFIGVGTAGAQILLDEPPEEIRGVDIVDNAGGQLPLNATFENALGERIALRDYFDGSLPAVIVMVYYDCPVVCPTVLSKVTESLDGLDFTTGLDYNLLVFSIDPAERAEQAAASKQMWMSRYQRASDPEVAAGWAFHVADAMNIRRLADALGWQFKPLDNGEYSHPVGIIVASPDGMISRYFYGYDYPTKQVKLSLLDATEGKIAKSLGDKIMHYCFRWDPTAGAYSVEAMAVMRIAGAVTVVLLGGFIGVLVLTERLRRRGGPPAGGTGGSSESGGADGVGAGASVSHA